MGKDFRDQLGDAAKKFGFETKSPKPGEEKAAAESEKKLEIKNSDRVYLRSGARVIQKYRNADGSLYEAGIGETVRMGYKDADAGFIVKSLSDDSIYGKVAEIEPVNYSYAKDRGTTYLISIDGIFKKDTESFYI